MIVITQLTQPESFLCNQNIFCFRSLFFSATVRCSVEEGRGPFWLGTRDVALGLAAPLVGRDDAVESAADCVQKRLVAERAADQLAPPQRGEGGSSAPHVEEIGEARRAVDERLHAHDLVVAAPGARRNLLAGNDRNPPI